MLGRGRTRGARIEQIDRIALVRVDELGSADADQAKSGSVGLPQQEIAADSEDLRGKLRRVVERAGACAQPEVRRLELERDRRARETGGLEPRRGLFAQQP